MLPSVPIMLSLPVEVVEDVLVYLAEDESPTAIACLAQSCRHFRDLIYDPLDKFLWRRIFLTTFDDPRAHAHGDLHSDTAPFDWGEEFRSRIWAATYVRRRLEAKEQDRETSYRLRSKQRASPTHTECQAFTKALHTFIRVLDTARPLILDNTDFQSLGSVLSNATLVDADSRTSPAPVAVDSDHSSRNVVWLRAALERGFPQEFNPRFSETDIDPYWVTPEDTQAVHKLVAFLGLNFNSTWAHKAPLGRTSPPRPRNRSARCEHISTDRSDMTPEELALRARYLARREVFDVRYLSRRRAWGPFLPYRAPGVEGEESVESDDDSDDSDYVPNEAADTEDEDRPYDEDEDEEDGDEDYTPHPPAHHKPPPEPENLRADWIHLAAIRVDCQMGLQGHPEWPEIQDNLTSWDSFRQGTWVPSKPEESTHEWDWAGVEGVWRRTVCWLDYRELCYHNRRGFKSANFDEATLIVPLTIRIVGYSPCPIAGFEHRPTIHIEGEMGGSGWLDNADARSINGTVGIIGDGTIRWSIISSVAGSPEEAEWASEGVQVGGPGSACGVLGMWTGAEHDANDPLGAWWQWRVA